MPYSGALGKGLRDTLNQSKEGEALRAFVQAWKDGQSQWGQMREATEAYVMHGQPSEGANPSKQQAGAMVAMHAIDQSDPTATSLHRGVFMHEGWSKLKDEFKTGVTDRKSTRLNSSHRL